MKVFKVGIYQSVSVSIDETKFTQEMMEEFNRGISDFGTDEHAYRRHALHLARLHAVELYDVADSNFIEGYGPADEAGILCVIDDEMTSVDIEAESDGSP